MSQQQTFQQAPAKLRVIDAATRPGAETTSAKLIAYWLEKRMATRELAPAINRQSPFALAYVVSPLQKRVQWRIKRMFDIAFTSVGLLGISPALFLVALAIKLEGLLSGTDGPLFFKQERVGLHGKRFHVYKFRSMHTDAEARLADLLAKNQTNAGMFKMEDDPRITRVGKFIRKYSLDEFPQLFNVLLGHMSLVGPRPPIPRELKAYDRWHHVRFATLPGMTGAWQVSGRSSITDFDRVVALDFEYISDWSLMQDIKILFKTIPVVLFGKGS
ncbi:MAG: sugar transferase [Vampirovibrionales bacterium]|nr:sugar transferase [Vampirovibrionales bacterium]